jgi:hypothetical protein
MTLARAFPLSFSQSRMERIRVEISYLHFPKGWPGGSRLRASSDHRFIVGALRATGTYQATPSFFCGSSNFSPFLNTP